MDLKIEKPSFKISVDSSHSNPLVVASHERSGTHFLINSIHENSKYTNSPILNFDLCPIGDIVNFYSSESIEKFFDKIERLRVNQNKVYLKSIIKTHHSASFFGNIFHKNNINFLYIYRNPSDTLISFYKFLHKWPWHEGLKTDSVYTFLKSSPEGQLTRYQYKYVENHFVRWAEHVSSWQSAAIKHENIMCVSYENLSQNYYSTIAKVFEFFKISSPKGFLEPEKTKFIRGKEMKIKYSDLKKAEEFIRISLSSYPNLSKLYGH